MKQEKKRGQPLKDPAEKCTGPLSVYLTLEERRKIDAMAAKEFLSASKLVRKRLKEMGII